MAKKLSRSTRRASKKASETQSYIRVLKWLWRAALTAILLYNFGQYQGYYSTTDLVQMTSTTMSPSSTTQQQQQQAQQQHVIGAPRALETPNAIQLPNAEGILQNREVNPDATWNAVGKLIAQSLFTRANSTADVAPNDSAKPNEIAPTASFDNSATTDSSKQIATSTTTAPYNNNNNPNQKALPKYEGELPSDWNEILKLRSSFMQQHHHPPPPPQIDTGFAQVRLPPPVLQAQGQPQEQGQIIGPNGQPIVLLRTDALYQKGTWDKSPIIIEKYKLVFFTVPKVGCTAFKQLFRRMMGYPNWKDHQYYNMPFLPHNPDTNGLKYLSDYPFDQANEMLTSPDWTRAIFVRKPEERVLSAYLDKSAYSKGYYLRMRCCDKVATGSPEWQLLQCGTGTKQYTAPLPGETNTPIMAFGEFLQGILPRCMDPHWEPQAIRMAPKYWERINFIGRFENVFEDTKKLLVQIGAWDEYGASGWEVDGHDGAIFDPSQKAKHGTNAQKKSSKSAYLTPENLAMISSYYDMDYMHPQLQFERPL